MRGKSIDLLPSVAKKKVQMLAASFKIFFKNQKEAEDVFKVGQATISRYLDGTILIPLEVAQRFSEYTNGIIEVKDIFFDLNAFRYDQKNMKS